MSVLLVKTSAELTALEETATAGDTYFNSDAGTFASGTAPVGGGTHQMVYLSLKDQQVQTLMGWMIMYR